MSSTPTTPPVSNGFSSHEASPVEASVPICPACRTTDTVKHGFYTRNPHGHAPVRVQRYRCSICGRTFSPSLSYIEDGHQYPSEVKRLGRVVNAFTDASLENLQDICTVHFGVRPSDQQLYNWIMEDTGEIVENDLPQYSGIYTYDEQYLQIDGERAYRFVLYDDLMDAPVGEHVADRLTKDAVRDFLTELFEDKPAYVITTDGRDEYAKIIEDDIGAFHHRCHFHFLRNAEKKLRNTVFRSVRYSNAEKLHAAIVWSEFKSVFAAPSYPAALRRFEAVVDKVEHLPSTVRTYVEEVMEDFDKFLIHLRDEWVPSTTNNVERYFGHTKPTRIKRRFRTRTRDGRPRRRRRPTRIKRRFRTVESARSFLNTQMSVRTVKHGLISRETSLALAREIIPDSNLEEVTSLFTETKQRYLWSRDLEAG